LFTLLRSKKTQQLYLVVNCHILFNKNRGDIKFIQTSLIMQGIREVAGRYSGEEVVYMWAGDFNTYPCSPLYNYLQGASLEDLMRFDRRGWSGQLAGFDVFDKLKSSMRRKLEINNRKFDYQKHGEYLFAEKQPEFFPGLYSSLERIALKMGEGRITFEYREKGEKFVPLKMKSAYREDAKKRKYFKPQEETGEILFSTVPIQECYPFTVDYLLYSCIN